MRYSNDTRKTFLSTGHIRLAAFTAVLLAFSTIFQARAQEQLYQNVVKIKAVFPNQRPNHGFGFVVHESNDSLYVVTAFHVVAEENSRVIAQTIVVSFYEDETYSPAHVIQQNSYSDLALLRVKKPSEYSWDRSFRAEAGVAGDKVWIIGYNEAWMKRSQEMEGRIIRVLKGDIEANFSGAQPGCSGGPLLIDDRIAGMVTADAGTSITALSIGMILRFCYDWLNIQGDHDESGNYVPAEPAQDLPFLAVGGEIGVFSSTSSLNQGPTTFAALSWRFFAECMLFPQVSFGITAGRDRLSATAQWDNKSREFQNLIRGYGVFVKYSSYFFTNPVFHVSLDVSRLDLQPQIKYDNGIWTDPIDQQGRAIFDSKTTYMIGFGGGITSKGSVLEGGLEAGMGYSIDPLALDVQNLTEVKKSTHWVLGIHAFLGLIIRNAEPQLKVLRY